MSSSASDGGPAGLQILGSRRFRRRAPVVAERDFRRPARPSGDRLKSVEDLCGRFAQRMQTVLASYLRAPVRSEGMVPEFTTFGGILAELAENDWLVPLQGRNGERAVLVLDGALQVFLVNRLLGATPQNVETDAAAPGAVALGPISRAAMALYLHALLRGLNGILCERETDGGFEIDEPRKRGPRARMLRTADAVVVLGVRLGEPEREGCLRLLLLSSALAQQGALDDRKQAQPPDPSVRLEVEGLVRSMSVSASVDLGSAEIDLAEYMKLQAGDVLVLNRRISQTLPVLVGGSPKFLASPGRAGTRLAIRIVRRVDEKEAS